MDRGWPRFNSAKIVTPLVVLIFFAAGPMSHAANSSHTTAIARTQKLLEDNKGQAALESINAFLKTQPGDAAALAERALVYGKLEQYDKAMADANQAVALAPDLAVAYANRAAVCILIKQTENAYNDANKAVGLDPKLAVAYGMRALVYERLDKFQLDIDDCDKAIALEPKTARYYDYRATAFRKIGQYKKALEDCNRAISLAPRRFQARVERGYTYFCLRDLPKALSDYSAAIGINPKSANAHALRADVYRDLGQFDKQISDLTQAIKIKPKQASFYEQRSHVYYLHGRLPQTLADCDSALGLNNKSTAASRAADALDEFGLFEKAIGYRTRAIDRKAKNVYLLSGRAKDYEMLGKYDLARSDWRKAFELATPSEKLNIQTCNPLVDFKNFSSESIKESIDKQLKANPVVLNFHYDDEGHICVPAQVNGHAVQLMLDTGCGHSDLWQAAMPGVAQEENQKIKGTTASGKETEWGFFRAQEIKLGHLTIPDAAMEVHEGLVGHKTLSGFLGGNVLENMVVTVDYKNKQVILATSRVQKSSVSLPMRISSHRPYCTVKLDNSTLISAILDTGNPSNTTADALVKSLLPADMHYPDHASGPWLGQLSTGKMRFKTLTCGAITYRAPILDVFPAKEAPAAAKDIILGNPFLSKFQTVTFDFPSRKIYFESPNNQQDTASSLYWEGRYYLSQNQPLKAIEAFSRSVSIDREFSMDCYYYRGRCYGQLKQYKLALADADKLIKLDDRSPWGYHLRALANDQRGESELAREDRERESLLSRK